MIEVKVHHLQGLGIYQHCMSIDIIIIMLLVGRGIKNVYIMFKGV